MSSALRARFALHELPAGVMVVEVVGDVDMVSAPTFAAYVVSAISARPVAVAIDLTHVDFLSAAGLEVLTSARLEAPPRTPIVVVGTARAITRPIRLMGVDRLVPLYSTLAEAFVAVSPRN